MSLGTQFSSATVALKPSVPKRKRPAPFSIRLTDDERTRLTAEAKGTPLGAYVKAKALGPPIRVRGSGYSVEDRRALAQALALLGDGELSASLRDIARAVSVGVLPVTPETAAALLEALIAVRDLRRLLVRALGLKEDSQ